MERLQLELQQLDRKTDSQLQEIQNQRNRAQASVEERVGGLERRARMDMSAYVTVSHPELLISKMTNIRLVEEIVLWGGAYPVFG